MIDRTEFIEFAASRACWGDDYKNGCEEAVRVLDKALPEVLTMDSVLDCLDGLAKEPVCLTRLDGIPGERAVGQGDAQYVLRQFFLFVNGARLDGSFLEYVEKVVMPYMPCHDTDDPLFLFLNRGMYSCTLGIDHIRIVRYLLASFTSGVKPIEITIDKLREAIAGDKDDS